MSEDSLSDADQYIVAETVRCLTVPGLDLAYDIHVRHLMEDFKRQRAVRRECAAVDRAIAMRTAALVAIAARRERAT